MQCESEGGEEGEREKREMPHLPGYPRETQYHSRDLL